ncbi:hypothetical protein ACU4GA_01795 [Methylobacterium oryzae CBMB20]
MSILAFPEPSNSTAQQRDDAGAAARRCVRGRGRDLIAAGGDLGVGAPR